MDQPSYLNTYYEYLDKNKNIDSSKKIFDKETSIQDNGFEDIFEFTYEDRSNSENIDIVKNNYSDSINNYSNIYGIDPILMTAILAQENSINIDKEHRNTQIKEIWNNKSVVAYNCKTNQNESSGIIDIKKCADDQDYCIKIACMILNNYYNHIHEQYGYKLSREQEISSSVWAFNKGISIIDEAFNNSNTYNDFKNYVLENSPEGDNKYIEHVFSYIPDQKIISMKTRDGLLISIMIDNTTVENKKR